MTTLKRYRGMDPMTRFDTYLDEAGQLWTVDRDKMELIDGYGCWTKVEGILKHVWSTDSEGNYQ